MTQDPRLSPQTEPKETVQLALPRRIHLVPLDEVAGFQVRPGFYEINGATAIPGGVNFTVHSHGATAIELLLFRRTEQEPYAVLPFPQHYRIGNVYSMIVFKLDIEEFEYAYRVDGPYEPKKGLIFDRTRYLLDPYAKAVTGQSQWGDSAPRGQHYKARVVKDDFDWGDLRQPLIPMEDLIRAPCPGLHQGCLLRCPLPRHLRRDHGEAGLPPGAGGERHRADAHLRVR